MLAIIYVYFCIKAEHVRLAYDSRAFAKITCDTLQRWFLQCTHRELAPMLLRVEMSTVQYNMQKSDEHLYLKPIECYDMQTTYTAWYISDIQISMFVNTRNDRIVLSCVQEVYALISSF